MKFLIDNCLSPKYATILDLLSPGEVVALRQEFSANTADTTWIPEIGTRGWTLLSIDRSQLRTAQEMAAIRASGAIGMYLAKKFDHMKLHEQAWRLMKAWPEIVRVATSASKGSCYVVSENGKIVRMKIR